MKCKSWVNLENIFNPIFLVIFFIYYVLGPPGSGKTMLLIEKIVLIVNQIPDNENVDKVILVMRYNKLIRNHIEMELKQNLGRKSRFVDVYTLDKFLEDKFGFDPPYRRRGGSDEIEEFIDNLIILNAMHPLNCKQYKHIFVDESQDLRGKWFYLVRNTLWTGYSVTNNSEQAEQLFFWILFDPGQNLSPFARDAWLKNLKFYYLTLVFRATQKQFEFMSHYYLISCPKCDEYRNKYLFDKDKLCSCRPKSIVNIQGPKPKFLSLLPDDISEIDGDAPEQV